MSKVEGRSLLVKECHEHVVDRHEFIVHPVLDLLGPLKEVAQLLAGGDVLRCRSLSGKLRHRAAQGLLEVGLVDLELRTS